jgi:hypothetical protein
MNKRFLALFLLPAAVALAQQSQDSGEPPPPEMPTNLTFETDVYFYIPKFTLNFGLRGLSGTKSTFRGVGTLASPQDIGDLFTGGLSGVRTYQDGQVIPDARVTSINNGDGTSITIPIAPDGRTNSWSILSDTQVVGDNVAFHTYTADVLDGGPRSKDAGSTYGIELSVARDIGRHLHLNWAFVGGLSINDINSKLTATEKASVTTVTDLYALNGQTPPVDPNLTQPSTATTTVTNSDGTTASVTNDTTILLPSNPGSRTTDTEIDTVNFVNHFKLKGAYYTFRFGPSATIPITNHLRLSLSAGAALVYAGTTYTVEQDFQPATGPLITETDSTNKNTLLPGYYADANVEYWLTERAGLYLGAVYQNSGNFVQTINTADATYSTKIDLTSLQGFRMGMNLRF